MISSREQFWADVDAAADIDAKRPAWMRQPNIVECTCLRDEFNERVDIDCAENRSCLVHKESK